LKPNKAAGTLVVAAMARLLMFLPVFGKNIRMDKIMQVVARRTIIIRQIFFV
jgi:hypothetical protein